MAGRKERRFGNVRELPSGRFQARYRGPDGVMRSAPTLFASRKDAGRWLTLTEAEILRGDWRDPTAGAVQFGEYAERWITERPRLRPRTVDLYRSLLRRHVAPDLAGLM
ncbi:MAG TPA: site-specific integrase, partial [Mycobacteriales bacterium]